MKSVLPIICSCLFGLCSLAFPQQFVPGCTLPFDAIKTTDLEIDATCSIDGNSGDNQGKRLESEAKNNFCAAGDAVPIRYATFRV